MYAVMFYVILNKRKLHFPLAKNVMHSPSYIVDLSKPLVWRSHTHERARARSGCKPFVPLECITSCKVT